jgi:hypothetical protein
MHLNTYANNPLCILNVIFSNEELNAQSDVHCCLCQFYMMNRIALAILISELWTDHLGSQILNG